MSGLPLSTISLQQEVDNLCKKAEKLIEQYRTGLFGKTLYSDMGYINPKEKLSTEDIKVINNFSKLIAINLLNNFDNIDIVQARGLKYEYREDMVNWGGPIDMKPSGEKSAAIHLWSGTSTYQEKFETKREIYEKNKD